MKGLELIKKAMKLEEVERIPWVPFVGAHAGSLLGLTATEYLQSADKIVEGVNKAIETYHPDGIPVAFDLQIEAEALGCKLAWADDNPPAVISHPLMEGTKLEDMKVPCACKGRIPMVMEATRKLREQHADVALYGLITGPFTLALHLLGTDIFMQMMMDPEATHQLMRFATDVAKMMAGNYIEAGADVIAIVDPMTSQIDPASFETFVTPYITEINDFIRDADALSSFFVCGNAQQNIEQMCKTKPDNISIDENIPLDYVRDIALKHKVSFGGNIKLTVVLLMGDEEASRRDALECMDIGGKKGFILAPGCDLAMATPKENLIAVSELVRDEVLQGELRASEAATDNIELLDLTNHWDKDKVVIDIITLDSSSCAPCQYMVDAVARASEKYGDKVVYKEHRIKEMEGVQMMATLGVKNLPTIVIDGNIDFISQIPPINAIQAKIEAYLEAKN
ncbi:uroporphyrinogen decarboxylase family protein [Saccharicrinis fermentans]|uniref:Uroporphyrinogen decarboxylase n=1 Tax=Saccharicrinis fermentans DSM 9555 = JCM 21142 TaxID=869213 RepID=W7YJP9_9BACT|nr:uroporphyrinogen decarboxylase family protein [Saccharicrinis fermentans]GAF04756.1 uroporphyrinogen decarboxylase [Saccharicrinis fermentans DSM 9555 = JCM 21142]